MDELQIHWFTEEYSHDGVTLVHLFALQNLIIDILF